MHRFYRDKNKDKGGLGFVVAVVVALAAAFLVGNGLMSKDKVASTITQPLGGAPSLVSAPGAAGTGVSPATTVQAQPFTVYMLQAAALSTPDQAQKAVAKLSDAGITAAVVQQGQWYKIIVGAYTDPAAVEMVKASLQPKLEAMKMSLYSNKMTVTDTPGVVPASAGVVQPIQQAAQDMNVYLQQTASWIEGYAGGQIAGVDQLQVTASKIAGSAKNMQQFSQDPAVGKFLTIAKDVNANAHAITMVSQTNAPADYQSALASYVTLLSEYKAWTMTPGS